VTSQTAMCAMATSRTIRVDDEVFAALQALAEPFTDNPNTVLRRVLKLDAPGSEEIKRALKAQGKKKE
jgi:predicted transcriptional regulator